jgi:hypothetical protein
MLRPHPIGVVELGLLSLAISGVVWNALLPPTPVRSVAVTTAAATVLFSLDPSRRPLPR